MRLVTLTKGLNLSQCCFKIDLVCCLKSISLSLTPSPGSVTTLILLCDITEYITSLRGISVNSPLLYTDNIGYKHTVSVSMCKTH